MIIKDLDDLTDLDREHLKNGVHTFCVLMGDYLENDAELFFGPLQDTDWILTSRKIINYPELFAKTGIFSSCGDAKRNGWNKEIPAGYSEISKIGKKFREISILNIVCRD